MGMGRHLYRRNDVNRLRRFAPFCIRNYPQARSRELAIAINWSLPVIVLALFCAASAFAIPSEQGLVQGKKAAPQEFAPEEFVSERGGTGFYFAIDLPGADREEVLPFKERWLSSWGRAELNSILENGSQYRHYVRRRLQEEGLPACIEYIPVIESSYKPLAKPASGKSVGLWQFMENSVENYLRLDKWLDERRDPWKSTDAAIKKLKANHKQFGDWLLAIAAYNCGAGAVRRALAKSPQKTFWALAKAKLIPGHAIAYVPNLLAVSDIAQNAAWYKLDLPAAFYDAEFYSPYDDFDYIETRSAISLKALACELRIDEKALLALNPALLYEATPAGESYELRLPRGMKASAEDAIFNIMLKKKDADNN